MTRKSMKIASMTSLALQDKAKNPLLARIYHLVSADLSDIFASNMITIHFSYVSSWALFDCPPSVILYPALFPHGLLPFCGTAPLLYVNCIFRDSLSCSLTFSLKSSLLPYFNLPWIADSDLCSYSHQDLFLLYLLLFQQMFIHCLILPDTILASRNQQ